MNATLRAMARGLGLALLYGGLGAVGAALWARAPSLKRDQATCLEAPTVAKTPSDPPEVVGKTLLQVAQNYGYPRVLVAFESPGGTYWVQHTEGAPQLLWLAGRVLTKEQDQADERFNSGRRFNEGGGGGGNGGAQ